MCNTVLQSGFTWRFHCLLPIPFSSQIWNIPHWITSSDGEFSHLEHNCSCLPGFILLISLSYYWPLFSIWDEVLVTTSLCPLIITLPCFSTRFLDQLLFKDIASKLCHNPNGDQRSKSTQTVITDLREIILPIANSNKNDQQLTLQQMKSRITE